MRKGFTPVFAGLLMAATVASATSSTRAAELNITVTNDQPTGGFALAPVWFGVQDGSFNVFQQGATASSAIATLSQFGNTAPLMSLFAGNGPQTTLKSGGSIPQFLPGQSASTTLNVADPSVDKFLSYAGMVVPSNDFFQGNANPLQIFDSSGKFLGPITINVYGSQIWDSVTEQLSTTTALTFIAGQTPGSGVQITNGAVTPFLSESGSASFLQSINGLTTAAGYQISHVFSANDLIDTITISAAVPEPASAVLLGLGMVGVVLGRQVVRARRKLTAK
jgi:hypothetical protein